MTSPIEMSGSGCSWARELVSAHSAARAPLEHEPLPVSEAPWMVEYELDHRRGARLRKALAGRPWSLWRYRELLPLQDLRQRIDLGEGGTPLVRLRRLFGRGSRIWLKEESGNPTGSFKARGLAMAVSRARELGAPGVQLPSAGNAALAAAAYAAAAGLPCRIALPTDTPTAIAKRCRLHGCEVLRGGTTLVEAAARLEDGGAGFWDLSTFKEPYRVEGKKTMGFELAEQFGWELPDWILYPTGGGTGIVAMAKAFAELGALGLIDPLASCRFAVVQMEGCAPVVRAFRRGEERVDPWEDPLTQVWGLRVPRTLADFLILRALRESGGTALAVAESGVEPMRQRVALQEGLWIGPEGAAALMAVEKLRGEGRIEEHHRVVVFQTGHPANYADAAL